MRSRCWAGWRSSSPADSGQTFAPAACPSSRHGRPKSSDDRNCYGPRVANCICRPAWPCSSLLIEAVRAATILWPLDRQRVVDPCPGWNPLGIPPVVADEATICTGRRGWVRQREEHENRAPSSDRRKRRSISAGDRARRYVLVWRTPWPLFFLSFRSGTATSAVSPETRRPEIPPADRAFCKPARIQRRWTRRWACGRAPAGCRRDR